MSITEAHWGGGEHVGAAVAVGHGLRAMGNRAWAQVKEARVAVERGRRSRWPEADGGLPRAPELKEPAVGGERAGRWRPEGREPTEIGGEGVRGVGHRWWWAAPTRDVTEHRRCRGGLQAPTEAPADRDWRRWPGHGWRRPGPGTGLRRKTAAAGLGGGRRRCMEDSGGGTQRSPVVAAHV
jgi:hypothetical protein